MTDTKPQFGISGIGGHSRLPGFLSPLSSQPTEAGSLIGGNNHDGHSSAPTSAPMMVATPATALLSCKAVSPGTTMPSDASTGGWFSKKKKTVLVVVTVVIILILLSLYVVTRKKTKKDDAGGIVTGSHSGELDDPSNTLISSGRAGMNRNGKPRLAGSGLTQGSGSSISQRSDDIQSLLTKQGADIRFLTTQISLQSDRIQILERLASRRPGD
jgi:hypothetical protein